MRNQFEPPKLPTFEPLKPLTLPNQLITQSVPAKQSFQEFAMAGGGVPVQYKGREHIWHAKVGKHEVSMKKGGDPLDEFVPPRYRSAGRRPEAHNDRTAAANMPVDFARGAISGALGAPGDIESLVRMIPGLERSQGLGNLVTGEHRETYLPTSEEIEKRLPFRSDTPQGRMASGLGSLAGGFYTGPGSPFNVAGKAAKLAGEGLGTLKGSGAGTRGLAGQRGVIKMPGGNFLTGRVEKDVAPLKTRTVAGETPAQRIPKHEELLKDPSLNQDQLDRVKYQLEETKKEAALDKWVEGNLSNYIKKQMATPDDPVRALAEQGITHKRNLLDEYPRDAEGVRSERKAAGFPEEGMAQSPMAKAWERASDESLATHRAGDIQDMPAIFTKAEEAKVKMVAARDELDKKFMKRLEDSGLKYNEVASLMSSTPYIDKARIIGDTAFAQANADYLAQHSPMASSYLELGRQNPWIFKVDPETTIYSPFTGDLGFDHIMDVLRQDLAAGRIRPEQMSKISISDAVRRTHQFDEDMAKKMAAAQAKVTEGMPVHKEYPEGYKWIELAQPKELPAGMKETVDKRYLRNEAGELVEDPRYKSLESALKYEGETMGHCVGGYCPDVSQGKSRIYSLRDAKGEPHVTIETQPYGAHNEDHMFAELTDKLGRQPTKQEVSEAMQAAPQRIVQIKGKQNRAPKEEYLPYVQDFVRGGKWSDIGDIQNTGMRQTSSVFNDAELQRLREAGETDIPKVLAGEDIQRLHNLITPEGKRLKYSPEGNVIGMEGEFAHGGEVHMQSGGLAKLIVKGLKAAKQTAPLVEAPSIIVPKGVSGLKEAARQSKGEYGARRVERAADEIPNLEKMYNEKALRESFLGDNAKAVVTMNPADFERYAQILKGRTKDDIGPKMAELARQGEIDKYTVPIDEYIQHLMRVQGGFDQVPYLNLYKDEVGIPSMPEVRGHEGRHRSRALAESGETNSLVQINPGGDLREGLPRRSQEEYINALREELERSGRLVLPEGDRSYSRPAVEFPEPYAKGGEVHMAGGGAIKAALAKLGKFATESDLKAIKEAGQAAHEQEAWIRAAKNAEIEEKLKSMPARSKAANIEMGMYHPVGGGLKLSKPFETLHSTRVKNPKVNTPEIRIMTPEDLYREKAGFFPLIGDKADTGTFLTHIDEKELEVPVGLGGGARYMDVNYNPINPSESAAWESATGRITSLGNQAQRIGESGRPVYGIYTAGSGTNTDFNIMGANAILQQLGQSKITKKSEKAFDQAMREGTKAFPPIPDWPGIRSPKLEDMLLDKNNGILRTKLFDTMGKENFQSMGFPDVPATRKAITDPQLLDTPTHEAGFRIAKMDPTGRIIEDPLHPSDYPTAMAGELAGQLNMGVDYKDMFSTHFANRRLLSQPESGDYYSFLRAFPIQYADQEWLDKIMKAQEAKDKLIKTGRYAKGGDVKPKGGLSAATKSCNCHD